VFATRIVIFLCKIFENPQLRVVEIFFFKKRVAEYFGLRNRKEWTDLKSCSLVIVKMKNLIRVKHLLRTSGSLPRLTAKQSGGKNPFRCLGSAGSLISSFPESQWRFTFLRYQFFRLFSLTNLPLNLLNHSGLNYSKIELYLFGNFYWKDESDRFERFGVSHFYIAIIINPK